MRVCGGGRVLRKTAQDKGRIEIRVRVGGEEDEEEEIAVARGGQSNIARTCERKRTYTHRPPCPAFSFICVRTMYLLCRCTVSALVTAPVQQAIYRLTHKSLG